LVVPSDLRARAGLIPGTPLTLIETSDGIVLLTREQLKRMVRRDLTGVDLVADLVAARRRAAADEDAASPA
jgi:bifunctional DNA-binding transcriptional regulator/antitoxin component of YhaV-PrlF toxin-antitoxin module